MSTLGYRWFNIFGDMEEFEQIFGGQELEVGQDWRLHKSIGRRMSASCSALVKVLPDASDIYFSHVTWNSYESMIRLLKKYSFEVHLTAAADSPLVPGHSMSFSSYPALIYSGDDFTVMSSGLVSMETTNGNNSNILLKFFDCSVLFKIVVKIDADLWKYIKPTGQVLEGIRATVANRLANTGS